MTDTSNGLQEEKKNKNKRTRRATPMSAPSTKGYYPPSRGKINMIQEGFSSKKEEDANTLWAYNASTIEEPYYICDSDFSITFTQNDHPPVVPRPGHGPSPQSSDWGLRGLASIHGWRKQDE